MSLSQLAPHEFEEFQRLIYRVSGIQVPETKVTLLSNRIRRRAKAVGAESFGAYLKLLQSPAGRGEWDGFLSAVTTNETNFFRTESHFEWLQTEFVKDMTERCRQGSHSKRIAIWSAACSSGEEPYTIAMCLAEERNKLADWSIAIDATDISEDMLSRARAGLYDDRAAVHIPEKLRKRYLQKEPDGVTWKVKDSLRQSVSLFRHNLIEPNPRKDYDCIFLRNVMIYFSRESKQIVINHLVNSLADGGYLVIGPSEGVFDMLTMLQKRSTFVYQKVSTPVLS